MGALASLPHVQTSLCLVPESCRIVSSYDTRGTTGSWHLRASGRQVRRRECLLRSPWASGVMQTGARLKMFTWGLCHTLPTPARNVWDSQGKAASWSSNWFQRTAPHEVYSSFKIKRNRYTTDHGTCCERTYFGGALTGYRCFTAAPVQISTVPGPWERLWDGWSYLVPLPDRKVLRYNAALVKYVDRSPRIPVYFCPVWPAILGDPPWSYSYSEGHLPLAAACPPALHEPPWGHGHSAYRGIAKTKKEQNETKTSVLNTSMYPLHAVLREKIRSSCVYKPPALNY